MNEIENEEVSKKLYEWYVHRRIKKLMNEVDRLYKEEDFFAAWGLALIICRLSRINIEEIKE